MDEKTKIRIRYLRFTSLYAVIILIALILFLSGNKKTPVGVEESSDTALNSQASDGYVYVSPDGPDTDDHVKATEDTVYTVKSHMGKIGIFTSDGELVRILEVYVKTLPEADIRLLEEGFEVVGRSQLNSIIEDYTE